MSAPGVMIPLDWSREDAGVVHQLTADFLETVPGDRPTDAEIASAFSLVLQIKNARARRRAH